MRVVEHREVERKYEVDWASPLPAFETAAEPVEHELTAVYFDTADLALAQAQVTLRRRTGGEDDGWHLKLPGDGERLEIQRPLGTAAARVPVQLERLVRVHARGRELKPVLMLRTRRVVHKLQDEQGRVLAEVCDDRVTAQADGQQKTWREWEAELAAGDDALLDEIENRLLDAGAQPAKGPSKLARALGDRIPQPPAALHLTEDPGIGDVLTAYVREQVAELKRRDPDVRRDAADAVHKMRVAMRRLRSALATYRPVLDRTATDPVRDELRWLGQQLGPARDAEVLREHLLELVDAEPGELVMGPVRKHIDGRLKAQYREAHKHALEALDDERYFRLLDVLDDLAAAPPLTGGDRPAHEVLPGLLKHDRRRLAKQASRALDDPSDTALHETRKAAKRVRYAAESTAGVLGDKTRKLSNSMQNLQDVLGAHQDTVVARPALRQLAVQAHLDGGNAFSYGRLHALEQARADESVRDFVDLWT